jgi:RNA polymerase sigma-70 factor, ECF subfamily
MLPFRTSHFLESSVLILRKTNGMEALAISTALTFNRRALIAIYEQYNACLYRYAYRMLGDPHLAEDCVSETFSRFLFAVRDGRGPTENVRAYLYRIAHNIATDHYRRRPRTEVPLNSDLCGAAEDNPDHQYSRDEEQQMVRDALFRLPIDQRRVLMLRFVEGWRHDEVAEALGKSPEATRALQHRALLSLKRMLASDEMVEELETGELSLG